MFERALRQIDLLEGRVPGRNVLYKALDLGYREGSLVRALNCIHAISDVDRERAPLRTWTSFGVEAARKVVVHLERWIKDPGKDHPDAWRRIWEAMWRQQDDPELARHYGIDDCIDCGICSYVCPSHLPLLTAIRILNRPTAR